MMTSIKLKALLGATTLALLFSTFGLPAMAVHEGKENIQGTADGNQNFMDDLLADLDAQEKGKKAAREKEKAKQELEELNQQYNRPRDILDDLNERLNPPSARSKS